jgi:hypothetical protein
MSSASSHSPIEIVYRIPVYGGEFVEVFACGPSLAAVDWRIVDPRGVVLKDSGHRDYGCSSIALRDALIAATEGL